MPVFADAGYLIALDSQRDQYHSRAVRHWKEFSRTQPAVVTTTFVLAEVLAVFNHRGLHAKAVEVGRRFFDSDGVRRVYPSHRSILWRIASRSWSWNSWASERHCPSIRISSRRGSSSCPDPDFRLQH